MSGALPRRAERSLAPLSVAQEAVWLAVLRREAVVPLSLVLALDGDCPLPVLSAVHWVEACSATCWVPPVISPRSPDRSAAAASSAPS